jgi:glycerophosphoryl diester phosphodiesterase
MKNKNFLIIFLLILTFIGYNLKSKKNKNIHPFLINSPKVNNIAHRGGKGIGPENTIYTFKKAFELGIDILEMDIHSTSDSILVVIHDHSVNRTTNGDGLVLDFNLEELSQLNAGYYWTENDSLDFPFRKLNIPIPTLEDVISLFPNTKLNIEIKQDLPFIPENLCQLIYKYNLEKNVLIGSFIDGIIEEFRDICPEVATSANISNVKILYGLNLIHLAWIYSPPFEVIELPPYYKDSFILDQQFINTLHKKNIPVYVWTINTPNEMNRLIKLNVDGIITDYPNRLSNIILKN